MVQTQKWTYWRVRSCPEPRQNIPTLPGGGQTLKRPCRQGASHCVGLWTQTCAHSRALVPVDHKHRLCTGGLDTGTSHLASLEGRGGCLLLATCPLTSLLTTDLGPGESPSPCLTDSHSLALLQLPVSQSIPNNLIHYVGVEFLETGRKRKAL